jgi:hypothetical protein
MIGQPAAGALVVQHQPDHRPGPGGGADVARDVAAQIERTHRPAARLASGGGQGSNLVKGQFEPGPGTERPQHRPQRKILLEPAAHRGGGQDAERLALAQEQ